MPSKIQILQQKKADLTKEAKNLLDGSTDGILSEEQSSRFDAIQADVEKVNKSIQQHQAIEAKDFDLDVIPTQNNAPSANGSRIEVGEDPNMEFRAFGDMLTAVVSASSPGGSVDPRLMYQHQKQAAASGLNVSTPSDGGFLMQTQFSTSLMEGVIDESALLSRCRNIPIAEGNDGLEAPIIDETSRATGSRLGGVQVYRNNEAATVTEKKPKFGKLEIRLEEMTGLAYITNRLLKNAPAMEAIVTDSFKSEFSFKMDDEIVRGTGAGQCLGFLNAAALVSIAKETGQSADTIVTENLLKMRAAIPAKNRKNAVWLINSECMPQLQKLSIDVGTGGQAVYIPNNGLADDPFDRMLGRPVIDIEQASALGDLGDITLVDLNEYLIITQGAIEAASSMHVKFLTNEMTFRFNYLINGMPVQSTSKTPYKGSQTKSPFVALAAR